MERAGARGILDATPEEAQERERRIAHLTRKRIKKRDTAAEQRARTLLDDLQDGRGITRRELRELAVPSGLAVVSLYLSLGPFDPQWPKPLLTVFHSLRTVELEAQRDFVEALDHNARIALDLDLREIESFLEQLPHQPAARGLVIFKSGEAVVRVLALPVRVPNRLSIDVDPLVAPLDAVLSVQHRALLVRVEKDRARFWTHWVGREEEVDHVESFVPSDTVDKSRPNKVQRHRLTHRHWHMRDVARATYELFNAHECDVLVLSGDEPELSEFRSMLASTLGAAVIGTYPLTPDETRQDRIDRVQEILAARRAEEEAVALEDLGFYAGHGRLASGLDEVIAAADDFMVSRLFVADGVAVPGYICRQHHHLSLSGGDCPYDGQAMLAVENVVDELLEMAWLYGVEVTMVTQRTDLLAPYAGIAAVKYPMEA
jgi:peptide subunit release factor 1 (eRF1)